MNATRLLGLVLFACWFLRCAGAQLTSGEELIPIKSGFSGPVSYGLFRGAPPASQMPDATTCDLVLMVRNTGSKVLRWHQVPPGDFVLKDAKTGDAVTITLVSKPAAIAYGSGTIIHLKAAWWPVRRPMPEKGVFIVKANEFNLLPEDLVFRDIPLDAGRKNK